MPNHRPKACQPQAIHKNKALQSKPNNNSRLALHVGKAMLPERKACRRPFTAILQFQTFYKKSETARWPGKALSLHRHCCAREARDLSRGKRATPECEKNNGYHEFIRRPIVLQQFLTRTTRVLNRPRPPSKVVTSCLT